MTSPWTKSNFLISPSAANMPFLLGLVGHEDEGHVLGVDLLLYDR